MTLLYPLCQGEPLPRAGLLRRLKSPPPFGRNIRQVNVTCCGDKRLDACCREARKHDGRSFTRGENRLSSVQKGFCQYAPAFNVNTGSSISVLPSDPMCHVMTQCCPHAAQIGPLSLPRPITRLRSHDLLINRIRSRDLPRMGK